MTPEPDAMSLQERLEAAMRDSMRARDEQRTGVGAAAFDVELVVLGPNCGDPLYRKAIRTSMAATLTIPCTGAESCTE